jgi:prepilin-type N-terminal cleavage/methylation domain-containing protein
MGPFRRPRRPAFTLIEMMVVVGILLILVAMGAYALRYVAQNAKNNQTQTVLNTADAMVKELDATGGTLQMNQILCTYAGLNPGSSVTQVTIDATAAGSKGNVSDQQAWVQSLNGASKTSPLYLTQEIMGMLLRNSNNMAAFKQLPPQLKMTSAMINGQLTPLAIGGAPAPLLLDGYGHPLLFVPPGGIQHVTMGTSATPVTFQTNPAVPVYFWLSAGNDGNFSTGDDNVCSKAD